MKDRNKNQEIVKINRYYGNQKVTFTIRRKRTKHSISLSPVCSYNPATPDVFKKTKEARKRDK